MDKILFIINPIAGGGRSKDLVPKIDEYMKNKDSSYRIMLTKGPGDATNIAIEGLKDGYRKIVAVGGDGTVNEVALGILKHGSGVLGIVGSGTGNDLARTLKIPNSWQSSIELILKGNSRLIDIGFANGKLFLNISSLGFDSMVVKNTERIKKKVKFGLAYSLGILITLISFKAIEIELVIDDKVEKKDIFLVAVGNGKYYGGGLKVLPMAEVEDGYLDVCIVKKMSKLKFLLLLPTIIKGKHINVKKYVEVYRSDRVFVKTKSDSYLNIDGEIKKSEEDTLFSINNKKLEVFVDKLIS